MVEVFLTYPTADGAREIAMDADEISLGRGDADLRVDDDGASRVNSIVFREDDNIWILDENSTNGTFVNGQEVAPTGTILKNGDSIKIGHYTYIEIRIVEKQNVAVPVVTPAVAAPVLTKSVGAHSPAPSKIISSSGGAPTINSSYLLPLAITALAFLVIGVSAIFIGVKVFGGDDTVIVHNTRDNDDYIEDEDVPAEKSPKPADQKTPKPDANKTPETNSNLLTNSNSPGVSASNDKTMVSQTPRKKYAEMSEAEKDGYVKEKAENIARIIGNQKSEPIPPEAVKTIRANLQGYVNRVRAGRKETGACGFGSDMTTVLTRAAKNAPFITRAFYGEGIDPQIGLYVAMIESEHCECLESPTHAKGMFQFLASSAPDYGLDPNDRCLPEPAAKAAAKYLKSLTGRFGTGPMSVPLAIASYNSGQGGLSRNLESALRAAASQERSFWTLVANQVKFEGRIGEQFRKENVKYVPKFFAAAIIGENPQDFGIDMQPLSTYTR